MYILPYIYQGVTQFTNREIMEVMKKHKQLELILGEERRWLIESEYCTRNVTQVHIIEHSEDYYLADVMLDLVESLEKGQMMRMLADELIQMEEAHEKIAMQLYEEEKRRELHIERIKTEEKNKRQYRAREKKLRWTHWFQPNHKKQYIEDESKGEESQKTPDNKEKITDLGKLKEIREAFGEEGGRIPVIELEMAVKNFREVLPVLGETFEWCIQLATFIDVCSSHYIKLEDVFYKMPSEEAKGAIEPMDYFLFDEQGNIISFIGIHTVQLLEEWYTPHGHECIMENNLRVFRMLIHTMYERLIEAASIAHNYKEKVACLKGSPLEMYNDSRGQLCSLQDLREVTEAIQAHHYRERGAKKKIGVFMDTANIYTPLRDIEIDFNKLFTCVYGVERLKDIAYKYCTLEVPHYKDEAKNEYELERKYRQKQELERYGFQVVEVILEEQHAKQKDDYALQEILEGHKNDIEEALILTGDGHFVDYFKKYEEQGIGLKIISVDEEMTSSRIKEAYGDRVQYIEKYWEVAK